MPAPCLASIPNEILDQINKRTYSYLSLSTNPLLYAKIFATKYDMRHLLRYRNRPSSEDLTLELAHELKNRCIYLRRFKSRTDSLMDRDLIMLLRDHPPKSDRIQGLLPPHGDSVKYMLSTAYLMMLENEGYNERQLREYAGIDVWLDRFWFHGDGSSGVVSSLRAQMWPENSELNAVAMWLFWILLKPETYTVGDLGYRSMVSILKLLSLGGHVYDLTSPATSWTDFHPSASEFYQWRGISLPSSSTKSEIRICPTPLGAPAILAFMTLANLPTSDDIDTPMFAPTSVSTMTNNSSLPASKVPNEDREASAWQVEWQRSCNLGRLSNPDIGFSSDDSLMAFQPGSLQGTWQGSFTYPEFTTYSALLQGARPSELHASSVGQQRQTWRLNEYYSFYTNNDGGIDTSEEVVASDDPLMGFMPRDVTMFPREGKLEIKKLGKTVSNYLPYAAASSRRVRDVLLVGDGHSAWGSFMIRGRIRLTDGMIYLRKSYISVNRGEWLYRGYLIGSSFTNGNITGRWRDTITPLGTQPGYEGCFAMGRR